MSALDDASQASRPTGTSAPPVSEGSLSLDAPAWHGPRIIFVAFASFFASTGLIFSIYGVLLNNMRETFGVSMAVMGLMPSIYHGISAVVSPFLGRHLSQLGIRRVMLVGAILLPLGLLGVSRSGSAAEAAIYFALLTVIGAIAMGALTGTTLLTNWYGPSRGRAMGLATTGSAAGAMSWPLLAAYLLLVFEWRDVLAAIAILGALISIPTLWLLAIDRPSDLNQLPESETGSGPTRFDANSMATPVLESPKSSSELLQTREFWLIAAVFGLLFSSGLVQVTYLVKYSTELGLTLQQAGWLMMVRAVLALLGQVGLARLSDRFGGRLVLGGVIVGQGLAWWMIVSPPNLLVFILAGVGFGFFGGSLMPLRGAMVAGIFGRLNFAKVSGLMVPVAMPLQIAAVPIVGLLFDRSQSFADAFSMFLVAFPVAAAMLFFIRDPSERSSTSIASGFSGLR